MMAIDPGAAGALVYFTATLADQTIHAVSMPKTDREVVDHIRAAKGGACAPIAYLEDLVKYTGRNMPSSSMATYAGNWGFIKGVLTALQYRIVLVPPKTWQKALGLGIATGMSKTEWKNKLKQRAEQLYPQIKVTLATADALLILEAARRGLIG